MVRNTWNWVRVRVTVRIRVRDRVRDSVAPFALRRIQIESPSWPRSCI